MAIGNMLHKKEIDMIRIMIDMGLVIHLHGPGPLSADEVEEGECDYAVTIRTRGTAGGGSAGCVTIHTITSVTYEAILDQLSVNFQEPSDAEPNYAYWE
jgi:hypothetical protein